MNVYRPEGSLIKNPENRDYLASRAGLEHALEKQIILEAPAILCDRDFSLHISVSPHIRAIIPRDEVQYTKNGEQVKDIAILTRVGKPVCFKVIGFSEQEGEPTVILSRRAAQEECMLNYISSLSPGDIIPAKITHLESFGAFVDIGCGIISLLSIDCISVSRISHPSARLNVGQSVYTVVKSTENDRIYVSMRELLGTWEENAALFSEGQTVRGVIRGVEDYGIFVELTPNLAGLAEYREGVAVGQTAAIYIKSILPDRMKIKLIIIDVYDAPLCSEPTEYFIDPEKRTHINSWIYSPECSKRVIRTDFV